MAVVVLLAKFFAHEAARMLFCQNSIMAERRFIFVILISENSSVLVAALGLQLKRGLQYQ